MSSLKWQLTQMTALRPRCKRNRSSTSCSLKPVQRRRIASASSRSEAIHITPIEPESSSIGRQSDDGSLSHDNLPLPPETADLAQPETQILSGKCETCSIRRGLPFPSQSPEPSVFLEAMIEVDDEPEDDHRIDACLPYPRMGSDALPRPPRMSCYDPPLSSPSSSSSGSEEWPSLSSITLSTPATSISCSSHALKQQLLARELDISVDDLRDLEEFANLSVSGSVKRSGRVLVQKRIRQRRSSTRSTLSNISKRGQSTCLEHTSISKTQASLSVLNAKDWWKEINWSRWSDSSSSVDSAVDFLDQQEGPLGEDVAIGRRLSTDIA